MAGSGRLSIYLYLIALSAAASVNAAVPHVFQPGQVIESAKMNENFAALASDASASATLSVDCSAGASLEQIVAGLNARNVTIDVSGACVGSTLAPPPWTRVRIRDAGAASLDYSVLDLSSAELFLEVPMTAATVLLSRGRLLSGQPFRSRAQDETSLAFLGLTNVENPEGTRLFAGEGSQVSLQDYGCTGSGDPQGKILAYGASQVFFNVKASCESTIIATGSQTRFYFNKEAGAMLSANMPLVVRVREGASFIWTGPEFTYPTDDSGNQVETPTAIQPEVMQLQARNAILSVGNVCIAENFGGISRITSSSGFFSPNTSCAASGSLLQVNGGSAITSGPEWTGVSVSPSSVYKAGVNDAGGFNVCFNCQDGEF